jgi:16S rRNA (cytosine967-C5)-methyltransferase
MDDTPRRRSNAAPRVERATRDRVARPAPASAAPTATTPPGRPAPPRSAAQEAELRFMRSTQPRRFGPPRDANGAPSDTRERTPRREWRPRPERDRNPADTRFDGPGGQRYAENRSRPAYPETRDPRGGGGGRRWPSRRDDRGPASRDDRGRPRFGNRDAVRRDDSGPPRFGPRRPEDNRRDAPRPSFGPRRDDTRRDAPRPSFGPRRDDTRRDTPRPSFGPRRDDTRRDAPRPRSDRPRPGAAFEDRPRRDDTRAPRFGRRQEREPSRDRAFAGRSQPASRDPGRESTSSDPREIALRILIAVDMRGAFSDKLLEQAHTGAGDPRDQALLHELVKGTLRWRGRLDAILDRIVHIGIAATQPHVRNVLRLGAYQILFLDRIPAHAAVDESVKLAHKVSHAGAAGLVNSVLRRLVEEKEKLVLPTGDDAASLAVWGSHPEWLVTRWLARFGPEATRALMLANNTPARLGLRVNTLRTSREALITRLAAEGVTATPSGRVPELVWVEGRVAPAALAAFRDGSCTAQDESEALVSLLVDPQPHERILDLCAAPGGKCTHLAERIRDEGEVWAMERAPERVASLEQTVARLGCQSVHVVAGDGRTYTFPMPFDRVLVDAPCSSLGVIGRRADARWRKGPETLLEMPPVQLELLIAGARRVRPGGVLVYSVCSFEPEETTEVVEHFLATERGFQIEPAGAWLVADVVDERGFMCVLPHRHGCDGAFAARFRRS